MHKISHSLSFSIYLPIYLCKFMRVCLVDLLFPALGPSLDFCFRLHQLRRVAYVLVSTFNIFIYLYLVFILGNLFMWSPVLLALVQYYIVLYIHVYYICMSYTCLLSIYRRHSHTVDSPFSKAIFIMTPVPPAVAVVL